MLWLKLVPRKHKKYVDMIEIRDDNDYPCALVHINTFFPVTNRTPENTEIYNRLSAGETLIVTLVAGDDENENNTSM